MTQASCPVFGPVRQMRGSALLTSMKEMGANYGNSRTPLGVAWGTWYPSLAAITSGRFLILF